MILSALSVCGGDESPGAAAPAEGQQERSQERSQERQKRDRGDGTNDTGARRIQNPSYSGKDANRPQIPVDLVEVASGFTQPTDVQFVPGKPDIMLVLEKPGKAHFVSLADGERATWLDVDVLTESEQGLLGLAFHPRFRDNGKLYLNMTVAHDSKEVSEISEWRVEDPRAFPQQGPERQRTLLRVVQPYPNHNAGQLQFGPDGYLYIGFGDGGYRGDPKEHGEDTSTLLGSMLRIDVDGGGKDKPYRVPADNPFVGREGFRPEIWAYGLRNPWRYSFDQQGRLVVADVGQDAWEEIDIVAAGDNLGWDLMEGRHCYEAQPPCKKPGLEAPIYEYGHEEGQSVTGGYVYTGKQVPELQEHYVFGDYVSGRLWALKLPRTRHRGAPPTPRALGKWPLMPVTFGRDMRGELYVADYRGGGVYRLAPSASPKD